MRSFPSHALRRWDPSGLRAVELSSILSGRREVRSSRCRVRRAVRALPDGQSESGRRPLRRRAARIRPRNPLRVETNFARAFNANPPVQSSRQKYSAWRVGQISRILSRIPSRQEGRIAIVTNVEAGSGGRETSQHSFSECRRTRSCGRPSRVVLAPHGWR